ncbi:hypothetical protein NG2371_06928 [Nocardia gamkensis]|nr:hypothetical protein [Nocardia gamkensis]
MVAIEAAFDDGREHPCPHEVFLRLHARGDGVLNITYIVVATAVVGMFEHCTTDRPHRRSERSDSAFTELPLVHHRRERRSFH